MAPAARKPSTTSAPIPPHLLALGFPLTSRRGEGGEGTPPAGALDVLDELGDELVAEVRAEVPRVQLHVPLQHDVEEHLGFFPPSPPRRPAAASESLAPCRFKC